MGYSFANRTPVEIIKSTSGLFHILAYYVRFPDKYIYNFLFYIYQRESFSISLLILIHAYLLQFPLFYLILSFIYQRQSFSIFLSI